MPVTVTAARTAVRAANAAGKQITITNTDGSQITGTARWTVPGYPDCRTLLMFGVTKVAGPYTVTSDGNRIDGPDTVATSPLVSGTYVSDQNTFTPHVGVVNGVVYPPFTGTVVVNIADITGIGTTAANSPLLLPATSTTAAQSNDADPTLGTIVNDRGSRIPDPGWGYGTGLE